MREVEYVTRGALLTCTMGTHKRRLNLPQDYGVDVTNESGTACSFITDRDCICEGEGKNISQFGVCHATEQNEENKRNPRKLGEVKPNEYSEENAEIQRGLLCAPLLNESWLNVKKDVFICRDGKEDYANMVTMDSYLYCKRGGVVYPITSGQEYEEDKEAEAPQVVNGAAITGEVKVEYQEDEKPLKGPRAEVVNGSAIKLMD